MSHYFPEQRHGTQFTKLRRRPANILGSATQFTAEEGQEAAGIYSDILTHVSTSVLQFINGDLDVDDDSVWKGYVSEIEAMDLGRLTEIVQTAYDRASSER